MKNFSLIILVILVCASCKSDEKLKILDDIYKNEFKVYQQEIADSRVKYLQLTGLFKLKEQGNSFGKSPSNTLQLPIETLPDTIGWYYHTKDSLFFKAHKSSSVKDAKDSVITKMPIYLDEFGNSKKLFHDRLNWQLITRANGPYLRIWDTQNPEVNAFKGFEYFDLNPNHIFDAEFTYYESEKTEDVPSQLGVDASTNFIGKVTFSYNKNQYSLDVGRNGFTMVSDETTGSETYGGGRYVYLDLPKKNGKVKLDFNRLYNPPCSFSKYTTCLYPPRQNNLPFKIEAGETIKRN